MRAHLVVLLGFALALTTLAKAGAQDAERVAAEDPALARVQDATPSGPSLEDRLAVIRDRIQRSLVYPPLARLHDSTGETTVRFEIGRDGRARDVRVVRSSGERALDVAAERAVVRAGVLPRVYGPLEVPVHFELRTEREVKDAAPR